MNEADLELLEEFVVESRELLEQAEGDLMALDLESGGGDPEAIHRIFRAVHSVKGAAGFFGLDAIGTLSHALESVLMRVRDGALVPSSAMVDTMLRSNDRLRALVEDVHQSNDVDVTGSVEELERILTGADGGASPSAEAPAASVTAPPAGHDPAELDFGPEPEQAVADLGFEVPADEDPGLPVFEEPDPDEPPTAAPSSIDVPLGEFALTPLLREELLRNGRHLYRITISVQEDLESRHLNPATFLSELEAFGDVLQCTVDPDLFLMGIDDDEAAFEVHLASALELPLAVQAFGLPASRIEEIPLRDAEDPDDLPTTPVAEPVVDEPTPRKLPRSARKKSTHHQVHETVRVKTSVLNALMEMAGEMVLARNRLVRTLSTTADEVEGLGPILHQMSAITTEVQEQIMRTRLQPLGSLFAKFRRVVRDVSTKLGKQIQLEALGGDVELDRTIIEGLSDPLNHLLRNSLDHGVELPADREKAGKPRAGKILLSAYHEAGMVNIDVEDDGRGIDVESLTLKAMERGLITTEQAERLSERDALNLIFMPGFSTAKAITDVSGRGVGMDVVRTNIEKLGGTVDIASVKGKGTKVMLKLPLTLAIVSSLIVEVEQQRFALPQVGLEEVIRLRPGEGGNRLERVGDADVLRHRGKLLPILRLADVLEIERTYVDPDSGSRQLDRRGRLGDRRSGDDSALPPSIAEQRVGGERRRSLANVQRILVLRLGRNRFGLMVDRILDNEEIVVKPLSRFVRGCPCFSGATILGDGTISMILDPMGIVQQAALRFDATREMMVEQHGDQAHRLMESVSLVMFSNGTEESYALPLARIARIEKVPVDQIRRVGTEEYLTYRGSSLRLIRLHDYLPVQAPFDDPEILYVLICHVAGHSVGLMTHRVLDATDTMLTLDVETITAHGVFGSAILDEQIVLLLDIDRLAESALTTVADAAQPIEGPAGPARVLLVEDTPALRTILHKHLIHAGAEVTLAEDGEEGWGLLKSGEFDVVVTDTQMPRMTGEALLSRIRTHPQLKGIPVVAVTSSSQRQDAGRVGGSGFNSRATKFDHHQLIQSINRAFGSGGGVEA